MANVIHVAVGVIRQQNQILIAKRPDNVHQGGLWEFPGGKVEVGESVEFALKRELFEELNISCQELLPLIQIPYQYPDKKVLLDVYWVNAYSGSPQGKEGQKIKWIACEQLGDVQFPAANVPIIQAISLPQYYLITPARFDANFLNNLEKKFQSGVSLVQLRLLENLSDHVIEQILDLIKRYPVSVQINTNTWQNFLNKKHRKLIGSALKSCNKIGFHLTSYDLYKGKFESFNVPKSASCHNKEDILRANKIGLDFIVLSPVQKTTSHPEQDALGWDNFKDLCEYSQVPVYALGGMSPNDRSQAIKNGAQGIAAISSLWGNNL